MKTILSLILWAGLALIPLCGYASWTYAYERFGPYAVAVILERAA